MAAVMMVSCMHEAARRRLTVSVEAKLMTFLAAFLNARFPALFGCCSSQDDQYRDPGIIAASCFCIDKSCQRIDCWMHAAFTVQLSLRPGCGVQI